MTVYLLLDDSASMGYQGPRALMTKWQYTCSLAAAFVLFLHRQRDAVSLAFTDDIASTYIKPSSRPSHYHNLMAQLHRTPRADISRTAEALERLASRVHTRSMVLVFSDFYDDPARLETIVSKLHYAKCETIFFHVTDPTELEFDFDEPVLLREMERGNRLTLSPELVRATYLADFQAHRAALAHAVENFGGDYVLLRTDEVPVKALGAYLARRELLS